MANHLLDQRNAVMESARALVDNAKSSGREVTKSEVDQLNAYVADVKEIDKRIAISEQGDAAIKALSAGGSEPIPGEPQYLDLSAAGRRHLGTKFAQAMTAIDRTGQKALLPAGESTLSIPTLPSDPLSLATVPANLLSILPVVQIPVGAQARYVRQGVRTNNAAAVAVGDLKPQSVLGLTAVDVQLKVYATVSESVDRFLVSDATALGNWIASDLLYCVLRAVEQDVISGDPATTPASIRGLLATTGIVTQAFTTNLLTSLRAAKTAAETSGYDTDLVYALSAADWSAAEQARASTGGTFDFPSAPGEAAPRQIWGVPVVVVTGLPAKTAILINRSSVALYTDSAGVRTDWGTPGDNFLRNQLTARTEGRFDLAVASPSGVIRVGTAA